MNYIVAILKVVPQYALTSNIVKCVKCYDPLLEIRSLFLTYLSDIRSYMVA